MIFDNDLQLRSEIFFYFFVIFQNHSNSSSYTYIFIFFLYFGYHIFSYIRRKKMRMRRVNITPSVRSSVTSIFIERKRKAFRILSYFSFLPFFHTFSIFFEFQIYGILIQISRNLFFLHVTRIFVDMENWKIQKRNFDKSECQIFFG